MVHLSLHKDSDENLPFSYPFFTGSEVLQAEGQNSNMQNWVVKIEIYINRPFYVTWLNFWLSKF